MKKYHSINKFLVRRPSASLHQFSQTLEETDMASTARRIIAFFDDQFNAHALFLASPNLYEQLQIVKTDQNIDLEKYKTLFISLYKYMARMTCRPTPFGTFAGCGVGEISDTTNLQMHDSYSTVRLDMDYLFYLVYYLGKCTTLRNYFQYYINSTLWECEDAYRYIERKFTVKGYKYIISEIDRNDFLDVLISECAKGQTIQKLVELLVALGIEKEEAIDYLHQLIDNQILVDQLTPSVCGADFFNKIAAFIKTIPANHSIRIMDKSIEVEVVKNTFDNIQQLLFDISTQNGKASNKSLITLFIQLDTLGIPYEKDKVIQTELFYHDPITANLAWLKKVRKGAEYISYFSTLNTWDLSKLSAFAKRFSDRYEEREVSLLEALDTEIGIGYLQNTFTTQHTPERNEEITQFLAKKLLTSQNSNVLEISPEELKQFKKPLLKLSDSLSMKTELYETKTGKDILCLAGGGYLSSGAGVIARFSYGNEKIDAIAHELTGRESSVQPTDFIIAEVDHIPEGRSGNVLARPTYRKYVINYMTPPSLDPTIYSIPLDDLMISVSNGKVLLRSTKLNKFVVPRITSAHNHHFGRTQPIYQLFGDMQFQNSYNSFGFNWGQLANLFQRYPRVVCDDIILQKATWILKGTSIKSLKVDLKQSGKVALDNWRKKHQLPRQVFWSENDQNLLIDFENELSLETFFSLSKNKTQVMLHENLSLELLPKVKNERDEFCRHEVIWFYKKQESPTKAIFNERLDLYAHIQKNKVQRDFVPGSEWTYLKIYCGSKTSTKILQMILQPLVQQFQAFIDKWFFIRYFDTSYHIRFRVKWKTGSQNERFLSELHRQIERYYLEKDIHKIMLDTYSRELERYDPVIINEIESLFQSNSKLVLALYDKNLSSSQIKLAAFKYIDSLLNEFRFSIEQREALLAQLATAFGKEFNLDKSGKKGLSQEFRMIASEINQMIDTHTPLGQMVNEFVTRNTIDIVAILNKKEQGTLAKSLASIVGSLLHMFINRLYTSDQRYWEMQIHQLMYRYYKQRSYKNKRQAPKNKEVQEEFKASVLVAYNNF